VFTARYGLSPHTRQSLSAFKVLMNEILSSWLLDATEGILFFGRMIGEGKWKRRRTTKKKNNGENFKNTRWRWWRLRETRNVIREYGYVANMMKSWKRREKIQTTFYISFVLLGQQFRKPLKKLNFPWFPGSKTVLNRNAETKDLLQRYYRARFTLTGL